jgi:hypothetical protein
MEPGVPRFRQMGGNTMAQEKVVSSVPSRAAATTRVVRRGERSAIRGSAGDECRARVDAELALRGALAVLLDGYPGSDDPEVAASSYRCSSVSIMASVDSVLIRHDCFTPSLREKVRRLCDIASNDNLLRVVDHALAIRLHDHLPADIEVQAFWHAALRFHLDSFLGLLQPPGATRPRQLVNLLADFHYQSVAWKQRASNLARAMFGLNVRKNVERLLLGLALEKDLEVPAVDLRWLADKAGISVSLGWNGMVEDAVARWRQLSGAGETEIVGAGA